MRILFFFTLFGFVGSIFALQHATSLPSALQAIFNPAYYFYLASTLPFEPHAQTGAILDVLFNTIFFAAMGALYAKRKHTNYLFAFRTLFALYLIHVFAMLFFEIVDAIGI